MKNNLALLSYGDTPTVGGNKVPGEFLIFPYGDVNTEKGDFLFSREAAAAIVDAWNIKGTQPFVDYEHQGVSGGQAPAAGWFTLQAREDGLWATAVKWTAKAAKYLADGEYRFFSPTFTVDEGDKKTINGLINVALTNLPATHNLPPLVAASLLLVSGEKHKPVGAKGIKTMNELTDLKNSLFANLQELFNKLEGTSPADAQSAGDVPAGEEAVAAAAPVPPAAESAGELPADAAAESATIEADCGCKGLGEKLRTTLGLAADATDDEVHGATMALKEAGKEAEKLSVQLSTLEQATAKNEMGSLIAAALADKKISKTQVASIEKMSLGEAKGFIAAFPARVATKLMQPDTTVKASIDTDQARVNALFGI